MRTIFPFFKVFQDHNLTVIFFIVVYLNKSTQIHLKNVVNKFVSFCYCFLTGVFSFLFDKKSIHFQIYYSIQYFGIYLNKYFTYIRRSTIKII